MRRARRPQPPGHMAQTESVNPSGPRGTYTGLSTADAESERNFPADMPMAVPATAPAVNPTNRRRLMLKVHSSVPSPFARDSSVARRAVRRHALLTVTSETVVHDEPLHAPGGRAGLGDRAVADRAVELGHDNVPPVRVENVRRLAKERLPDQGSAARQQLDQLRLLVALALGLGVAGDADVAAGNAGEGLLLVVGVARGAGQVQILDVLLVVEGDGLVDRAARRAAAAENHGGAPGKKEEHEKAKGGRAAVEDRVSFHQCFPSGGVLRNVIRLPTSLPMRTGQRRPISWARRYIPGPWRHSAVARVMELKFFPRPRRPGPCGLPSAALPWQWLQPRPSKRTSPSFGEPPGSAYRRLKRNATRSAISTSSKVAGLMSRSAIAFRMAGAWFHIDPASWTMVGGSSRPGPSSGPTRPASSFTEWHTVQDFS